MKRYFIFSTICIALLLVALSSYSAAVALPVMVNDLNTNVLVIGLVFTVFSLVSTVVASLSGKISDVLGSRNAFILNVLLFSLGSLSCALSPNVYILILSRAIQAAGSGGLVPVGTGIVASLFPEQRQRYIGLTTNLIPIGMIVGPNIGGWLVEIFGWRSIFWFNIPFGILAIVLLWFLLPSDKRTGIRTTIDFAGAGLMFAVISCLLFGITVLGNNKAGIPWLVVGILFISGILSAVFFIRRERRAANPIIELPLLADRPFLAANLYSFIYGATSMAGRTMLPLYAVSLYGMSTLESGVLLTPWSITMVIASTVVSLYLSKWGYRWLILIGTLILAIGLVFIALEPQAINLAGVSVGATPILFVIMAFCAIGTGAIAPVSNNVCIELMPEKVVALTGIRNVFRSIGAATGIALATMGVYAISSTPRAFNIVMLSAAFITLTSIPFIFMMPASAETRPASEVGLKSQIKGKEGRHGV